MHLTQKSWPSFLVNLSFQYFPSSYYYHEEEMKCRYVYIFNLDINVKLLVSFKSPTFFSGNN